MNKCDYLSALGLTCVGAQKASTVNTKQSNAKITTTNLAKKKKFSQRLGFSFPFSIIKNNSFLNEKFYKNSGQIHLLNYEQFCGTTNISISPNKSSSLNKSKLRRSKLKKDLSRRGRFLKRNLKSCKVILEKISLDSIPKGIKLSDNTKKCLGLCKSPVNINNQGSIDIGNTINCTSGLVQNINDIAKEKIVDESPDIIILDGNDEEVSEKVMNLPNILNTDRGELSSFINSIYQKNNKNLSSQFSNSNKEAQYPEISIAILNITQINTINHLHQSDRSINRPTDKPVEKKSLSKVISKAIKCHLVSKDSNNIELIDLTNEYEINKSNRNV